MNDYKNFIWSGNNSRYLIMLIILSFRIHSLFLQKYQIRFDFCIGLSKNCRQAEWKYESTVWLQVALMDHQK